MNNRLVSIIEQIKGGDRVRVCDLAQKFSVSEMTIRRDLETLEREGMVVRIYGGCVPTEKFNSMMNTKDPDLSGESRSSIAQRVCSCIKQGQTIMLDAGCVDYDIVRYLPHDPTLTVVTSSLTLAHNLQNTPINVFLIGGMIKKQMSVACGPVAEKTLQDFRVDTLITTCDGVDCTDGFYISDVQLSSLNQAMIKISETVVVLAESEKFGRRALVRFAVPQEINIVVTDSNISETDAAGLCDRGVQVFVA